MLRHSHSKLFQAIAARPKPGCETLDQSNRLEFERLQRLALPADFHLDRVTSPVGATRVVRNPKGYGPRVQGGVFDNLEFREGFVVEV